METKIIKAVFGGGTSTVTNKRTRTDYGQVLEIIGIDLPDTFECIFSNSNTSAGVGKKMIGSSQRVLIPDEYLATGQAIYAWVLVHDGDDDGRHMYSIRIPVADMPDTSPEEPTPVEQSIISQAITALNTAVDTTTQKAQEATDSADRAEHAAEGVECFAERAEAAQSAAESARDRATQAETSARTSAATASEKASEAISSATTASQSALTAENASESASASADASYQNAETAYRYAQDSATSAGQAGESEQTASQKATEASQKASEATQSASTAVQAKTDAETAKTASQTAQGRAESARDEAVSAKTDAESARDEAQSIADGITGKVEQIDSNTDRIESLEDDRYKPYVVDTASGAVASFPDGADGIPLKSCIVNIEPVQDLHGYDSPWPAGGGVNKFDPSLSVAYFDAYGLHFTNNGDGGIRFTGTATRDGGVMFRFWYLPIDFDATGKNVVGFGQPSGSLRFDVSGGRTTIVLTNLILENGKTYDFVVYVVVYEGDTAPTSWTPYSNECPITGWTGCEVKHSGEDTSNPTTYPITFPTEAGIVYGGYVDATGGELVVDRAQIASYNGEALPSTWISDRDVYASGTTPTIGAQVVYKLAEPIRYPLTPTEIKTLLGTNNIWANTGDVSVEYRADVTLYINKKIAEAISALS